MYLIITIDTEEDNWGEYARRAFSVQNVGRIPELQQIFAANGVRPTYLITYPIATSERAIDVLGTCQREGSCEIGTHLHAWNTPPVEEELTAANSFVNRLPSSLQFRKLKTLHDTITNNFGVAPTSFRSGRWGFSDEVARHLIRLQYRVDTSISAMLDWQEYGGPDYSHVSGNAFLYRTAATLDAPASTLLEVPATVGFLQGDVAASTAYRTIRTTLPFGGKVLAGLDRLRILNRISISPELDDPSRMIRLTKALIRRNAPVINMFFHSPSLLEGCSPYVRTRQDATAFLAKIDQFLRFARGAGLSSKTLSELTPTLVGATSVQMLDGVAA